MNKSQVLIKKYSPIVLTTLSVIGVVSTAALGIYATPKALDLISKAEEEKGSKLNKKEIIHVSYKPYIPMVISGITTITSIISNHYMNAKTQASLVSAYMALNNMHNEYVEKTKQLYGEESDTKVKQEIALNSYYDSPLDDEQQLFFDYQSMRYFESTIDEVIGAVNKLNAEFAAGGYVTVNMFYELIGIKPVSYGNDMGWYAPGDYYELEFEYEQVEIDDGLYVYLISMKTPPSLIEF